MCLYPRLLPNPKYKANKKNRGIIPEWTDDRVLKVAVGCQKCMECRKQKARGWSIRMQEEIRHDKTGHFVTLTFSNESIRDLTRDIARDNEGEIPNGYELDNAIATIGVRRFLERWRKENAKSVKHWLITELGQGKHVKQHKESYEHLHIHGLIFTKETHKIIKHWQYGHVWIGHYVAEDTINYMVKYMTKQDEIHTEYVPKILCSAGIGSGYTTRWDARLNQYEKGKTDETYKTRAGKKINLPTYYRNKIYTEEQREKLWLERLDKQERWVDGQRIDVSKGMKPYYDALAWSQAKNERLGYQGKENWEKLKYENERRELLQGRRIDNANPTTTNGKKPTRPRKAKVNKKPKRTPEWIQEILRRPDEAKEIILKNLDTD